MAHATMCLSSMRPWGSGDLRGREIVIPIYLLPDSVCWPLESIRLRSLSKEVSFIKGVIGVDDSSVHEESKSYHSAMGE
jgi:hypothetical protein